MMKEFKNILFVNHGLEGKSHGLTQAIQIAENNQADLKGLIVCPSLPASMLDYEATYEQSLIDALATNMSEIQTKLGTTNHPNPYPISIECGSYPAVRIIRSVHRHHNDLLIKDAELQDDDTKGFKALDMKLLRKCPCPIWLNKASSKAANALNVAVAIDPCVSDPAEQGLAIRLLRLARSVADSTNGTLHIVSCWDFHLESYLRHHSWIQIEDRVLDAQVEIEKKTHREALEGLIEKSAIKGDQVVHHLHGTPDDEIPNWILEKDIDVLVMGTVARSGIQGLLVGNTAENIFQTVNCSLVVLKPDNFVSPIQ
ncbi:universal stress protein [Vibrio alfacsensis]|uniref:universal stress protein n=1 Tax=Vibrio alfacsensis TaxID=1074311 RepID=UPI001CED1E25|nr:universal stress protein [Vibrio alfacsensis]